MNVTVMNHKGGVGKTVTAVHLAAFLAVEYGGESVVLVDTDPNEGALDWAEGGGLPYEVMGPDGEPGDEEHTVYDSQGRLFGSDLETAAVMSDLLVVPSLTGAVDLRTLLRFAEDLEEIQRGDESAAAYRVLLTSVPRWPSRAGARAREALAENGVPLFDGEIRNRAAFGKAGELGIPVYEVKDKRAHQGWEDYVTVGREMVNLW